jgi:hypothetical protein
VQSLGVEAARNRTICIGGPANLTPLEVVQIFERSSGHKFVVDHVPEEILVEKRRSAVNPLDETFAALKLEYASGCPMDMKETLSMFPIRLTTVQEYADSLTRGEHAHV